MPDGNVATNQTYTPLWPPSDPQGPDPPEFKEWCAAFLKYWKQFLKLDWKGKRIALALRTAKYALGIGRNMDYRIRYFANVSKKAVKHVPGSWFAGALVDELVFQRTRGEKADLTEAFKYLRLLAESGKLEPRQKQHFMAFLCGIDAECVTTEVYIELHRLRFPFTLEAQTTVLMRAHTEYMTAKGSQDVHHQRLKEAGRIFRRVSFDDAVRRSTERLKLPVEWNQRKDDVFASWQHWLVLNTPPKRRDKRPDD